MTTKKSHTCCQFGLAVICCALAACTTPTPSATPTPIPPARTATHSPVPVAVTLVVRTATATRTPSATPSPSATLPASRTPSPSPSQLVTQTPTGEPSKQVLIRFANRSGGDGGAGAYGDYFGYQMPDWVLYTDGQLVMTTGNWMTDGQQAFLTTAQMCRLLSQIEATGFYEVTGEGDNNPADSVYNFPGTPEVSYGAYDYYIQVNGYPAKYVRVYWPYEPYVVPAVRAVYNLLHDYQPTNLSPFQATKLVIWVEVGRGYESDWLPYAPEGTATATPAVDVWPETLPPLADLLPVPSTTNKSQYPVYVQGELAAQLLSLPKRYGLYNSRGQEYLVFIRPLMPDETATEYPVFVASATEFELPFSCD